MMQNIWDKIRNLFISCLKTIWENRDMTLFYISFLTYIVITFGYLIGIYEFPTIKLPDRILPSDSNYIDTFMNLSLIIKDAINTGISNPILILHPLSGSLMLGSFTYVFIRIIKKFFIDKKEVPKRYFIFLSTISTIMIVVVLNTMYYSIKSLQLYNYIEQDLIEDEEIISFIILSFILFSSFILAYMSLILKKISTLIVKESMKLKILFLILLTLIYFTMLIFPFIHNYIIVTKNYNNFIWNHYFFLLHLPSLAILFFSIIIVIFIIKGINSNVWVLGIGLITLISVGIIFGFIYYDRDFALRNTEGELPGFAGYSQPSKELFEQKYYKVKSKLDQLSLEDSKDKCLNLEKIEKNKTKSEFIKAIEKNCGSIFLPPEMPNSYLKEVINEGDKSSHPVTLLDALFYSSYSITTTGYGIIPLDRWIKLLTFIENIFEVIIITGIIGNIGSTTNEEKENN